MLLFRASVELRCRVPPTPRRPLNACMRASPKNDPHRRPSLGTIPNSNAELYCRRDDAEVSQLRKESVCDQLVVHDAHAHLDGHRFSGHLCARRPRTSRTVVPVSGSNVLGAGVRGGGHACRTLTIPDTIWWSRV